MNIKPAWKYVFLLTAVVVVACSKEWPSRKGPLARLRSGGTGNKAIYASEWTTVGNWKKDGTGFHAVQSVAPAARKGKVLLFARNLWATDAGADTSDLPLQLPLQFLPYTDDPGVTETWQYELSADTLRINLAVAGTDTPAPRDVTVRYVVVPENLWAALTEADPGVEALPYEDLVAKLDIHP